MMAEEPNPPFADLVAQLGKVRRPEIGPGGLQEELINPITGEFVTTSTSKTVATRKAPTDAFVCWKLESLAFLMAYGVRSLAGILVLSHALRAKMLGHRPVKLSYPQLEDWGVSRQGMRTMLAELDKAAVDLGWFRVVRRPKKASLVEVTDLGLRQMAPPRSRPGKG